MRALTVHRIHTLALLRSVSFLIFGLVIIAANLAIHPRGVDAQNKQSGLARPLRLDDGISWRRDPATGELYVVHSGAGHDSNLPGASANSHSISVVTQVVPVTCSVVGP